MPRCDPERVVAGMLDGTFEGLVGTVYDRYAAGELAGHFELRDELLAAHGAAPVGLYATVAEGAASIGTALDLGDQAMVVSGISNDTTVVERVCQGVVAFLARCRHTASDLSVWDVEFRDTRTRLIAVGTVRVAIRPPRGYVGSAAQSE